jgi:hypothetical protein
MIRNLYRRLERLEAQTMPMDEPRVWQSSYSTPMERRYLANGLNGVRAAAGEKLRRPHRCRELSPRKPCLQA